MGALRGLSSQVRAARARGGADASRRRALAGTLRALVERTHDFTDSAYTSHEHRQQILALAERIAYELERLVAVAVSLVSIFKNLVGTNQTICKQSTFKYSNKLDCGTSNP